MWQHDNELDNCWRNLSTWSTLGEHVTKHDIDWTWILTNLLEKSTKKLSSPRPFDILNFPQDLQVLHINPHNRLNFVFSICSLYAGKSTSKFSRFFKLCHKTGKDVKFENEMSWKWPKLCMLSDIEVKNIVHSAYNLTSMSLLLKGTYCWKQHLWL